MEWLKLIPLLLFIGAVIYGAAALFQGNWDQASAFFLAALICDQMLRSSPREV
jgi:hypothetical protein